MRSSSCSPGMTTHFSESSDKFSLLFSHIETRTQGTTTYGGAGPNMTRYLVRPDRFWSPDQTFRDMLPQHFSEVLTLPAYIRECFEQGGFVCNMRGRRMHAVALDEAHEMLVNKDNKTSIVRPTEEYLNRVLYYPVRAHAIKQLKSQLFPPDLSRGESPPVTIFHTPPADISTEHNINSIINRLAQEGEMLFTEKSGLYTMSGVQATPEQQKDLLTFRDIGKKYHIVYIQYRILKDPSVNAPNCLKRLHTFSTRKKV